MRKRRRQSAATSKPVRSPAWKIVNKEYPISIPKWFFRDQDYQDEFGLITSGDRKHDAAMIHEMIPIRATALQMAEWFDKGLTKIEFNEPKTTPEIYTNIKDVLQDWIDAVPWQVGLPELDVQLLRRLDRFADSLYRMALRNAPLAPMPKPRDTDKLKKIFGGFARPGQEAPKSAAQQFKENPLPDRSGMADRLEEAIRKRERATSRRR